MGNPVPPGGVVWVVIAVVAVLAATVRWVLYSRHVRFCPVFVDTAAAAVAGGGDAREHGLDVVELVPSAGRGPGWPRGRGSSVTIVTWNIERGQAFDALLAELLAVDADVLLLQELDISCGARSGNRDVPHDLARALADAQRTTYWYCFMPEFAELGVGSCGGDVLPLHGNAIISRLRLANARGRRLSPAPFDWARFGGDIGEPRRGYRNAVYAALPDAGVECCSVHLENFCDPAARQAMFDDTVAGLAAAGGTPQRLRVVGGDMNTMRKPPVASLLPSYCPPSLPTSAGACARWFLTDEALEFVRYAAAVHGYLDVDAGQMRWTATRLWGCYRQKLDYLMLRQPAGRGWEVVGPRVGGDVRQHSDHRYVVCTVCPLAGLRSAGTCGVGGVLSGPPAAR